jgi:membrane protease YdiL (CAAX protease family)
MAFVRDVRANRPRFAPFSVYVVVLHVAWAAWPFFLYPRLAAIGEGTLAYALANLGIRFLVWVLPVFGYLRYVDRVDPFEYLKLTENVRRGLIVAVALIGANVGGTYLRFGLPRLSVESVTWNSILGTSFLIGFIEEIPYRGFMLQKFAERFGFWRATLITSLLFVEVHMPGWIALHVFRPGLPVTIFIFAMIMALAFKYSRSLWTPIVMHSANNFLTFVVFHM